MNLSNLYHYRHHLSPKCGIVGIVIINSLINKYCKSNKQLQQRIDKLEQNTTVHPTILQQLDNNLRSPKRYNDFRYIPYAIHIYIFICMRITVTLLQSQGKLI